MRSRSAGLVVTLSSVALALAAGCGGSSGGTGAAGQGGGGTSGGGTSGGGTSGGGTSGGAGAAGTGASGAALDGGADAAAGTSGGAGGAAGTTTDAGPDGSVTIPDALAVPAGATLKFKAHGVGSQIYTCTATPADGGVDGGADGGADAGMTTYAWVFKAPDAKLYDENGTQLGTHYAGPTWMSITDGSDVVGAKVAQVNSPLSDAIPWLLLKAASHMGTGVFDDVTYVQRLDTTKGLAPATGCDAAASGMDVDVAYTADYYFYTGGLPTTDGGAADWPFAAVTIPDALATPTGTALKLELHGIGAQIYTCTPSGGADGGADAGATTYAWVLKAPAATLYDQNNTPRGTHSAGPTWTSIDGSSIVGARLAAVNAPASTSDAIQWLMLKVASHAGAAGVFSDVTYVQRLNTSKGVAPATGCSAATANTDTSSPYSADYYFYTGDAPADGGADSGG
jgi:hypothetical protein